LGQIHLLSALFFVLVNVVKYELGGAGHKRSLLGDFLTIQIHSRVSFAQGEKSPDYQKALQSFQLKKSNLYKKYTKIGYDLSHSAMPTAPTTEDSPLCLTRQRLCVARFFGSKEAYQPILGTAPKCRPADKISPCIHRPQR
jgi:hypothetical protein